MSETNEKSTIDITPDAGGLERWARTVLDQEPADSTNAEVARKILAELGIEE